MANPATEHRLITLQLAKWPYYDHKLFHQTVYDWVCNEAAACKSRLEKGGNLSSGDCLSRDYVKGSIAGMMQTSTLIRLLIERQRTSSSNIRFSISKAKTQTADRLLQCCTFPANSQASL